METKVFKRVKRHWPTILIAVILGLLMILPFFYFQNILGNEYKGVLNQVIDDELFYMARIKDVMDGHPFLGNAYLFEHKSQLPQQLFLPEFLLAQPLKLLNLDIIQGRIFYNFILPAAAFVLTYLALYLIYPSRLWANLFAVFLFFGIFLFKFTRPVIPQFVFLFWLTQFIFLWQFLKNPSNKTFQILSILNFGLLFYIYPFYWTFYLVFLVILTAVFFFKSKLLSKQFLRILIGGLLIGSVYFYLTFLASRLSEYQETLTRLQLVFSRSPSEIKTVLPALLVLILIGVLYRLKFIKINKEILFFTAGIISILLVTNQNIITGQKFEFGHYRMLAMFFFVFTLYYLFTLANTVHVNNIWRGAVLLVIGLFIFQGISGYISRTLKISEQDVYNQKYKAVFDWLNENTPKDSVVYADNNLSELIPVYTANNVFYTRAANLFFISDQEVLERFILNNYFSARGGSAVGGEKFSRNFVIENERAIWGVRYIDRYGDAVQANKWRKLLGLELKDESRLPEEETSKVITKVNQVQKGRLKEEFRNYRVDYLIWDREKNPSWKISEKEFRKAAQIGQFLIYTLD